METQVDRPSIRRLLQLPPRPVLIIIVVAFTLWGCIIPVAFESRFGNPNNIGARMISGACAVPVFAVAVILSRWLIAVVSKSYWGCWSLVALVMVLVGALTMLAPLVLPEAFAPLDGVRAVMREIGRLLGLPEIRE